jgi:hypothetical protein
MGVGASLLPISIFDFPWAPAELPRVKQPGSWCAEVDEDMVVSCEGIVVDLKVIGVDLAFRNSGADGVGIEELAPSEVGVELPDPRGNEVL